MHPDRASAAHQSTQKDERVVNWQVIKKINLVEQQVRETPGYCRIRSGNL